MATTSDHTSFVDQMNLLVADAERGQSIDESDFQQLEVCFAYSSLLSISHESTYPSAKDEVRAVGLLKTHETRLRLARQCLDIIAGRSRHELLNEARAKESLLFNAKNADMLVRLVRRAMLELGPRKSD